MAVLGEAIFSKLDLLGEKARDRLLNAQLSLYLTKLFPRVTPPRATHVNSICSDQFEAHSTVSQSRAQIDQNLL